MMNPLNPTGQNLDRATAVPLVPTSGPTVPLTGAGTLTDDRSPGESLAAVVALLARLDDADELNAAADRVVRELVTHLSARRVFLLWRKQDRHSLAVIGDSTGGGDQQETSLLYRWVAAAGEEIAVRAGQTSWPESGDHHRHALLAVDQLGHSAGFDAIDGIGLRDAGDHANGVLIVADSSDPRVANFLRLITSPLTSRLQAISRLAPTPIEKSIRTFAKLASRQYRTVVASTLLLALVVLMLPVRYTVPSELELRPVAHRFVAVPFDGPLESALVRPGDTVRTGDLLASINPREIEYELAGIRAELNRAMQEKKGMMAEHDSGGSKIAALESDRLRLQSELLQYRRGNLEIRSPIEGVVVTGDWKQSEGMPLNRGDTLFEIAPLGKMVVELAIAEDDFAQVRDGMPVRFYVHALPGRKWLGTVTRIHPRAELREHQNVFIAETEIDDPNNVLRPGMSGRAKIVSDRHALGWNLFHKPYYALRRTVGW